MDKNAIEEEEHADDLLLPEPETWEQDGPIKVADDCVKLHSCALTIVLVACL